MTNIDQFESLFKKADKPQFKLEPIDLDTLLVVTDLDPPRTAAFTAQVADLLDNTQLEKALQWHQLHGDQHGSVSELLEHIEQLRPDMVCTYRNVRAPAVDYPYSLGVYLDVLSQATPMPILVLPSPHRSAAIPTSTRSVMAITDHLTGDDHLVSYAARLTARQGTLWLTHVEDQMVFERYIEAISKIPAIDTETARESLMQQLLAEPHDYIRSCGSVMEEAGLPIKIEEIIALGHFLRDYQRLIEEHDVDLLVMNTKQEDQLAMHGVAYPLCVELRDTPILML